MVVAQQFEPPSKVDGPVKVVWPRDEDVQARLYRRFCV